MYDAALELARFVLLTRCGDARRWACSSAVARTMARQCGCFLERWLRAQASLGSIARRRRRRLHEASAAEAPGHNAAHVRCENHTRPAREARTAHEAWHRTESGHQSTVGDQFRTSGRRQCLEYTRIPRLLSCILHLNLSARRTSLRTGDRGVWKGDVLSRLSVSEVVSREGKHGFFLTKSTVQMEGPVAAYITILSPSAMNA
jgi:hypothetical protein